MARRNTARLALVGIVVLAVLGGGAYFFTRDKKEQEQLLDTGRRGAIQAEIQTTKALIKKYDEFLKVIRDAKKSGSKPEYKGYDGFSYDKESEYQAAKDEQERRLADLQKRLDSAYDR